VGIAGLSTAGAAASSAFVIDPLGWAYAAQQSPTVTFPCYFPAFPSQLPNPPGTSPTTTPIYIFRAGVTANDYWPPAATMPVAPPIPMSFFVADRMMRSTDDVLFEYDPANLRTMKRLLGQPDDFDQRPIAINNLTANLTAASAASAALNIPSANSPNFAGEFSWIASVSRVPSDMGTGVTTANLHRFQVTVVVLANRDLTLWTQTGGATSGITLEEPPSERQVYAMFTQYGGMSNQSTAPFYGGGGLQLYVYEGAAPVTAGQPSRHWLDNIKPNTYLMLAAPFQTYTNSVPPTAGTPYPRLAWYRIMNVDDGPNQDPNNASRWYRNVTVTGGDWPAMWYVWTSGSGAPLSGKPVPLWYSADTNAPNGLMPYATGTAGATAPVCFCTLMNNSIASYDAVITLDYSLVHE
jgi:hypothetical protein